MLANYYYYYYYYFMCFPIYSQTRSKGNMVVPLLQIKPVRDIYYDTIHKMAYSSSVNSTISKLFWVWI